MIKLVLLISLMNLFFAITRAQTPGADSSKKNKGLKLGIGIKAGLNFANVSDASTINSSSQSGFHAGLFFGGASKSLLGFRTELMYSQQGYNFSSDSISGSNKLGYLMLAQLMAINITRFVQIQIGGQMGYLLNAKFESSIPSTGNERADKIISLYNRFDFGFAGGVEIHPISGLLFGARYNISFGDLYKRPDAGYANMSSSINLKNNVVQLFVGYRF